MFIISLDTLSPKTSRIPANNLSVAIYAGIFIICGENI
jgi:hypothetical protein